MYRVIDRGLEQIVRANRALDGKGVTVGIQSGAGKEPDGTRLVDVAVFNEFGTEHIPARPFLRGSFDEYKNDAGDVMWRLLKQAERGASTHMVLQMLGQWYESKVKLYARGGTQYFAPNAPGTIRQKGSKVPLIDKGKLINAIRYALVEG